MKNILSVFLALICGAAVMLSGCSDAAITGISDTMVTDKEANSASASYNEETISARPSPTAFDTGAWDISTPFSGITLDMFSDEAKELLGEPDDEKTSSGNTVITYEGIELFGRNGTVNLKFGADDKFISCRWEGDMFYYDKDPFNKYYATDFYSSMVKTMKAKAGEPDGKLDNIKHLFIYYWQMESYYVDIALFSNKNYKPWIEYGLGDIKAVKNLV